MEDLLHVEGVRGEAAAQRLLALEEHQCRIDAARVALIDAFDADAMWSLDGASSAAAWMGPRLGVSGAHCRERVKVARWLRRGELVRAALQAGRLSWDKVVLFPRYVTEGCAERFVQDEHWLVETCTRLRVDHCARFLRYWASHADPDGADDDDARRWDQRSLFVAETYNGMGDVRANLTPEALLRFQTLLDHVCDQLRRDEDPKDPAHVERTPAQRRHDAFVEILRRAAAWDAQNGKSARPDLVAYLDHEVIRTKAADDARRTARQQAEADQAPARPAGDIEHQPDPDECDQQRGGMSEAVVFDLRLPDLPDTDEPDTLDEDGSGQPPCGDHPSRRPSGGDGEHATPGGPRQVLHGRGQERPAASRAPPVGCSDVAERLDQEPRGSALACGWHGPVITRATAHRWLCEADIALLLTRGEREVLDHGRAERLFTPAQRRAIVKRQDGECLWPDCDRPVGWLEVHHLLEWDLDHGPTDLDNGVALCRFHHGRCHEGGFSIRGGPIAGYTFHRPDGCEIHC